jgi:hypothetical protein
MRKFLVLVVAVVVLLVGGCCDTRDDAQVAADNAAIEAARAAGATLRERQLTKEEVGLVAEAIFRAFSGTAPEAPEAAPEADPAPAPAPKERTGPY